MTRKKMTAAHLAAVMDVPAELLRAAGSLAKMRRKILDLRKREGWARVCRVAEELSAKMGRQPEQ